MSKDTRRMGVGSSVVYRSGDDQVKYGARHEGEQRDGLTAGIYKLVDTDDYVMCGMVEIEDSLGRRFGIDARLIELAPDDPGWPYDGA